MLASYITARARLALIDILDAVVESGSLPLYSDTDSVYFQQRCTDEKLNQCLGHLLSNSELGKSKLEMQDNVGEDTATGVFVAPKLYALRGTHNVGEEKVKAKGVAQWMFSNDDTAQKRRDWNE